MSAKLKQGFMRNVKLGAGSLRLLMNLWPPFIGAGIHVERLAPDYREAVVRMRLGLLNRNYMGTHFGGSLFAMTDPFFALLVMHNLGRDYVVWDKASSIDYKLPGRGTVRASFRMAKLFCTEVPPLISATGNLVKSVFEKENGLEEAVFRRADHRVFTAGGSRHTGQGVVSATWLQ